MNIQVMGLLKRFVNGWGHSYVRAPYTSEDEAEVYEMEWNKCIMRNYFKSAIHVLQLYYLNMTQQTLTQV